MKKKAYALLLMFILLLYAACGVSQDTDHAGEINRNNYTAETPEATPPAATAAPALGVSATPPAATAAPTLGVSATPPAEDSSFSVTFLDVGQGDAALIECDGHYMLIDGGDKKCSDMIYSFLKRSNIDTLDIIVASHAHSDHVGGLPGALTYAKAKLVLCPVTSYQSEAFHDFVKYAQTNGPGITVPKAHEIYSLGSAEVEILGLNAGTETNDSSIVLSVQYMDTTFLFTGDAEREAEQALLNDPLVNLSSYVLKVGHHGSNSSTTYPFLREIMPTYAVISCGKDNSYGHPTDGTLSRLRDADVKVLRTDLHGDITFAYEDGSWYLITDREAGSDAVMTPGGKQAVTPAVTAAPAPTGMDYIGNKNTMKFHYPNCSGVKRMSEKNKVFFYNATREEILGKGYAPCGLCNP